MNLPTILRPLILVQRQDPIDQRPQVGVRDLGGRHGAALSQVPELPFTMLSLSTERACGSLAYFFATACSDGPVLALSTEWQVWQLYLVRSFIPC